MARYSFVGSSPYDVIKVGEGPDCNATGEPLAHLEAAMARHKLLPVPSVKLPAFDGGAVGYVSYDAVRHFEPRTAAAINKQADALGVPEAVFMLADELVVFDHVRHTIKVVAHVRIPRLAGAGAGGATPAAGAAPAQRSYDAGALADAFRGAVSRIDAMCRRLAAPLPQDVTAPVPTSAGMMSPQRGSVPAPASAAAMGAGAQPGAALSDSNSSGSSSDEWEWERCSSVGRSGYEGFVRSLKGNIVDGDIIQAVPSHRISRELPGGVAAFDIYRQLRVVNPSPYMFYIEAGPDFQVRGRLMQLRC